MKITESQFNKIKKSLEKGESQTSLAKKYGLSQATVSRISRSKDLNSYLKSFSKKYTKKQPAKKIAVNAKTKKQPKKTLWQKIKAFFS